MGYLVPKKCVGVELIAIFNPGVSASKKWVAAGGSASRSARSTGGSTSPACSRPSHRASQLLLSSVNVEQMKANLEEKTADYGVVEGSKVRRRAKSVSNAIRAPKSVPNTPQTALKCILHISRPRRLTLPRQGYLLQPRPTCRSPSPGRKCRDPRAPQIK